MNRTICFVPVRKGTSASRAYWKDCSNIKENFVFEISLHTYTFKDNKHNINHLRSVENSVEKKFSTLNIFLHIQNIEINIVNY